MTRPTVHPILCLRDNYCYLLDAGGGDAWLVDPSEAEPPLQVLRERDLRLRGILLTHHHHDHVGGVPELLKAFPSIPVAAHVHDRGRIDGQSVFCDAPADRYVETDLQIGDHRLWARKIPGHTLGAIAWVLPATSPHPADVFTGDTLFAAGCGRLFEGTPGMMHASLQALTDFPGETKLWFGHEYTAQNLRFAAAAEPDNAAVAARARTIGPCTTPTTVADERATNPFVRAPTADVLAQLRSAKDDFRG